MRKRLFLGLLFAVITFVCFFSSPSNVSASSLVLKKGMRGESVVKLQKDLKTLGYFSANTTGYFGDITEKAVKNLQKKYGYTVDGIAGKLTLGLIDRLLGRASGEYAEQTDYMLPWFDKVSKIFAIGDVATVYDIESGLSFKVKRTYGHNHADCETLTAEDTETMRKIFGGWTWQRRAVIVMVDGYRIAASAAGMPHAGNEKYAANKYIASRSGGYGRGINYDAVKGNGMSGHFDLHFYGSKTHGTNRVNSAHQAMVKKANEWAKKNY